MTKEHGAVVFEAVHCCGYEFPTPLPEYLSFFPSCNIRVGARRVSGENGREGKTTLLED